MAGADLIGVGFVKNLLTPTGGPGGHFAPPACGIQSWQGRWT